MRHNKNEILLFLVLLFVLSSLLYLIILQQDSFIEEGKTLGVLLMWTPGISAILVLLILKKDFRLIGWRLGKPKYFLLSYCLPIVYILMVYFVCAVFNLVNFQPDKFDSKIMINLLVGPFINIIATLGEEIGWRGFLLPNLYNKYSYAKTSFIIGAVWALWHSPLILFTDFVSRQHPLLTLVSFSIFVISITFAFNWIWLASRSIWAVSILHAVHNFYVLNSEIVFDKINDKAVIFVGDYGIGIPLICILVAFIFWKLRNKLPASPTIKH